MHKDQPRSNNSPSSHAQADLLTTLETLSPDSCHATIGLALSHRFWHPIPGNSDSHFASALAKRTGVSGIAELVLDGGDQAVASTVCLHSLSMFCISSLLSLSQGCSEKSLGGWGTVPT